VFVRSGGTWSQQQKLTALDGAGDDEFGYSAALSGDTVLVGAVWDDVGANTNQGSAYVFVRSGDTWSQQQKLMASDGAVGDRFGSSVALSGDTALVGAYVDAVGANTEQGSAEVFVRTAIPETREPIGSERQLTTENDAALAAYSLNPAEDFWFKGARGDSVHGFIVKPPNFDPARKYPVVFLIHGGPQGAWLDNWGGRWNFQLFGSIGAAVVAINPRGSTGYGQAFVDGVSKDWGGKVYEDLMRGLDAALERSPWMDPARVAAAGGSFGGYMVNWMAGHTDRFKAFVSHAGIFNLENMYGATEEIWFTEWEMGGPFWQKKAMDEQYRRWSPHLSAQNFKTPMLVLHGEQDYRVPYYEGVALFSALQRQGVPSRFVIYPDEGHWILKPQNARLWYAEVLQWIGKYVTPKVTS